MAEKCIDQLKAEVNRKYYIYISINIRRKYLEILEGELGKLENQKQHWDIDKK